MSRSFTIRCLRSVPLPRGAATILSGYRRISASASPLAAPPRLYGSTEWKHFHHGRTAKLLVPPSARHIAKPPEA